MRVWICLLLMALVGCAVKEGAVVIEDDHHLTCTNRAECDRYWQRAKQWITDNSAYPIRQVTDWVILTPSPTDIGLHPSYTVLKTPTATGGATITLQVTCAVFLPCIPPRDALIERFNGFVAGK